MTEAERLSLHYEMETCDHLSQVTGLKWLRFDQDAECSHACSDGFLVNPPMGSKGGICGMFEIKCRDMSPDDFRYSFKSEWLVSYQKLEACRYITSKLRVPFIMALRLLNGNVVLVTQVWDARGDLNVPIRLKQTTTQKSVNGGIASRPNAYINMSEAEVFFM
jgi:hypothetical protein